MNLFQNRNLVIATKHAKETVIAPIVSKELDVHCFTPDNFDTDKFGTFSGEIERKLDPISTAREKCLRAMEQCQTDLGIASEGSFGPDPITLLAYANEEILIFIDLKNNLEVVHREISLETNFNGQDIVDTSTLLKFAHQVGFPSHALILRNGRESTDFIKKGIVSEVELIDTFNEILGIYGQAFVETDMRAMFNPTRMKIIEKATLGLINKIQSCCPACKIPGFVVTECIPGLLCEWCCMPTKSIRTHVYVCKHCSYRKEEDYPNQKLFEDPMYCDYCNP